MADPIKNNNYWQNTRKHPGGRPRKFETPEDLEQAWLDYFEWCDNNPLYRNEAIKSGERAGEIIPIPIQRPYTEYGFQAYHAVGQTFIYDMNESFKKQNDEDSRKFSKVLTWARNSCTANKIEGAVAGLFKENIVARLEGLAERSQISLPDVKIENASPDNQAVLDEVIRRLEGMERGESNEGASGNPV